MLSLYSIYVEFKTFIFIYWVVSNITFGLYAKSTGYSKWYLACIPIVNLYCRREIAGINIPLLILYAWCLVWSMFDGFSYLTVILLFVKIFTDYLLAKVTVETTSPVLYAVVPFFKYYVMYKEGFSCVNTIKATPIRSTRKMTKN